jgi:dihydrofolate reductase
MEGFGGFILGRNMFGPVRGEWPDDSWKGWWGDNPPYNAPHAPVFVLTHHARTSVEMAGGTIFHFVTHGSRPRSSRQRMLPAGVMSRLVAAFQQCGNISRRG